MLLHFLDPRPVLNSGVELELRIPPLLTAVSLRYMLGRGADRSLSMAAAASGRHT